MTRRDFLHRTPFPLALGSIGGAQIALADGQGRDVGRQSDPVTGTAEQPEWLAAKQAIAELVHRYAQVVRMDCPELTADLYAPGGVFELRRGSPDSEGHELQSRAVGRDAIRSMLLPGKGRPHPVPLIHNLMIEVNEGGDTARGSCVMQSPTSADGEGFWGEYRDSFVLIGGRWLFAERVFTMFHAAHPR